MTSADPMRRSSPDRLAAVAAEARRWLFEAAAPAWAATTVAGVTLFPERQALAGIVEPGPYRLFVQARHVFAYCELGRLGWTGPWLAMVDASIDFLLTHGRRADGCFVHSFGADGGVHDGRADLYDQAFMLLALAYAGRSSGRAELFAAAEALDDKLQARWRRPHGGYWEGEIAACPPFRQNPHMHLLESFIALHKATGAPRWRQRADEMATLCARCFLDPRTGALIEYFDASFRPLPGEPGRIVEPGHCFEWAWLFEAIGDEPKAGAIAIADGLVGFARRHGVDSARGVAVNEVTTDGAVRNGAARLWPQTERLKAALARLRRTGAAAERDEALAAFSGLRPYLETAPQGLWRDKLGADGSWIDEPAPGSSLYHITCALAELIDTAERDSADPARTI